MSKRKRKRRRRRRGWGNKKKGGREGKWLALNLVLVSLSNYVTTQFLWASLFSSANNNYFEGMMWGWRYAHYSITQYTLTTQQLLLLLGPIKSNSLVPNPVNKVIKLITQIGSTECKKKIIQK